MLNTTNHKNNFCKAKLCFFSIISNERTVYMTFLCVLYEQLEIFYFFINIFIDYKPFSDSLLTKEYLKSCLGKIQSIS